VTEAFADTASLKGYHAHIYYDPATTRAKAARLRQGLGAAFPAATLGSWHDEAVGPHTVAMYQVAFAVEDFARLVPWLMLNRGDLDVLVHPLAGATPMTTIRPMRCGSATSCRSSSMY
jgi:DOPA 4,5-dioxygenase